MTPPRAVIGVLAAACFSAALLVWATSGFAVLTTDGERARNVRRAPVAVPDVPSRDANGTTRSLWHDDQAWDGRPRAAIVDFVYTRCLTLCVALGGAFQQLQQRIIASGLQQEVRLVSVSFDVEHDTPARLTNYARVMRAQPNVWTLRTPLNRDDRDMLLQSFGVQTVPDGAGGWVHNAAFHIVDPRGRLVRIVDIDNLEGALTTARQAYADNPPCP